MPRPTAAPGGGDGPKAAPVAVLRPDHRDDAEALRREQERAVATLAAIVDGVIRTDAHGLVDYMNPAAEALTGWSGGGAPTPPPAGGFPVYAERNPPPQPHPGGPPPREGRGGGSPPPPPPPGPRATWATRPPPRPPRAT